MELDADKNEGTAVSQGDTITWTSRKKNSPSITIRDRTGAVVATVKTGLPGYTFGTPGTYKYSCAETLEMHSAAKEENPEDIEPGTPPPPPPNTIIVSAPGGTRKKGGGGDR